MSNFVERVSAEAAEVKVLALLLSLLAFPFYVLGFIAAVVFVAFRWCYAAVRIGFADVVKRGETDAG